jgi:DNA polymerase-1
MMQFGGRTFSRVTLVDFEFGALPGERPSPICCVARDLESGQTTRLWEDDLRRRRGAPYPTDRDSLVVAYYASAEIACHLALGWPVPALVLDLFVEFRVATNGRPPIAGNGLLGALVHYGLDAIDAADKEEMRQLAMRGAPWTNAERSALLAYCEGDVVALVKLLSAMLPTLDVDRALLRGRFMVAAARIEHTGLPIDMPMLTTLRANWTELKLAAITTIDRDFGVFEGTAFKVERWARWLAARDIPWPRLKSGALALDDDTFKEMVRRHPVLAPMRELRGSLSKLRLNDLAVGGDGRNRCLLSAFAAKTSRNLPSSVKFIFGPAVWVRGLIRPGPGMAVAYVDYCQQEFGIAAALSGDPAMLAAYMSGDPYLEFAKQAGVVPPHGTRESHGEMRELFKSCALGVQYGMGTDTLAARIGRDRAAAGHLLRLHRQTYPRFWRWSDAAVDFALLRNEISSVFGWRLQLGASVNARSVRNFPMQSNGGELLRLACCRATEAGVRVCAPVHDAVLIEAPIEEIDAAVAVTQQAMSDAAYFVLSGVRLRSDAKVVRWPDRYADNRGGAMWAVIQNALAGLGGGAQTQTSAASGAQMHGSGGAQTQH